MVGVDVIVQQERNAEMLVVTERGMGKKTALTQYRVQRRGGTGIKTAKRTQKTGALVAAHVVSPENEELITVSRKGQIIRTPIADIPSLGRQTQGVRVMNLAEGDAVASLSCL